MSNIGRINEVIHQYLAVLRSLPPLSLSEWSKDHFYLSKESSYTEGQWTPWPFQIVIMDIIGSDDIELFSWRKSKRIGYTKILLAAICYKIQHKSRNIAIWQPTDGDAVSFVKTELDTVLRDIPIMKTVFPAFMRRHKDNTQNLKKFVNSLLHILGGTAAKNYRRISVDDAMIDEGDAFDLSIEGEGSGFKLAGGRIEGSTFPSMTVGSTPKFKGVSMVDELEAEADMFIEYYVPCPHCKEELRIRQGGPDLPYGFKFDPDTFNKLTDNIQHLCEHCGALFDQSDYFRVWTKGRYKSEDGRYVLPGPVFYDADDNEIPAPKSIAAHIWAGYSPQVTWESIVDDFLAASKKASTGNFSKLITYVNTTLGESWEIKSDAPSHDLLRERAEDYAEFTVPMKGLVLTAGVDVQRNPARVSVVIRAVGRGDETWRVWWGELFGETAVPGHGVWPELADLLSRPYPHESGVDMYISATGVDSGDGRRTEQVYDFVREHKNKIRNLMAIKGSSNRDAQIFAAPKKIDMKNPDTAASYGLRSYPVGTDKAKDLLFARLPLTGDGPGVMHWFVGIRDDYFDQVTAEVCIPAGNGKTKYEAISGRPHEALDCEVYAEHAWHNPNVHIRFEEGWKAIEDRMKQIKMAAETPEIKPKPVKSGRGRRR